MQLACSHAALLRQWRERGHVADLWRLMHRRSHTCDVDPAEHHCGGSSQVEHWAVQAMPSINGAILACAPSMNGTSGHDPRVPTAKQGVGRRLQACCFLPIVRFPCWRDCMFVC